MAFPSSSKKFLSLSTLHLLTLRYACFELHENIGSFKILYKITAITSYYPMFTLIQLPLIPMLYQIPRSPELFTAISVTHKQKSMGGRETKNDTMIHINRQRKILRYNHPCGMVRKQRLMQILFLQIKCNNGGFAENHVFCVFDSIVILYTSVAQTPELVYCYGLLSE